MSTKNLFGKSQVYLVLSHLFNGPITPVKARAEYRVERLADVVYKLKKQGWHIRTTMKVSKTGQRYAEYRLV